MNSIKDALAVAKSINRYVKKSRAFEGGRAFGVDWPTWYACYPQLAGTFNRAGEIIMGRPGRYMPPYLS
jgi:hypothetical protein